MCVYKKRKKIYKYKYNIIKNEIDAVTNFIGKKRKKM